MIITIYDIASPYSLLDFFDLATPECYSEYDYGGDYCYGVSVDTDTKVYAADRDNSSVARMDKVSLLGDLLVDVYQGTTLGSMPTYSAIIEYQAAPEAAAVNTFGNIIW